MFRIDTGGSTPVRSQVREDHRVGLAAEVLLRTLLDVLQRVGGAAVLGQAVIGVVGHALFVENHVLQHGAELDGFQMTGSFFSDRSMHLA
ncbi:hypothetical protein P4200_08995 [Pseudomonas aeruginosa]|nr:hypothetical protein [Pseudomonas aeruginosa]